MVVVALGVVEKAVAVLARNEVLILADTQLKAIRTPENIINVFV